MVQYTYKFAHSIKQKNNSKTNSKNIYTCSFTFNSTF